jgi:hypothetical protein
VAGVRCNVVACVPRVTPSSSSGCCFSCTWPRPCCACDPASLCCLNAELTVGKPCRLTQAAWREKAWLLAMLCVTHCCCCAFELNTSACERGADTCEPCVAANVFDFVVLQYSFGHALGNTLLPLFLMLSNHIPPQRLPSHLRVLFAAGGWEAPVLPAVAKATLSHDIHLLPTWLSTKQKDGLTGICFR